jgi:hypothetical protein
MTDRCDAASRRPRDYSSADTACEPTHEEKASSEVASQQATEREAEARRNAYFASGADEGGRSRRASSDTGALQTATPDDKTARIIANATKYDHPIQDDPVGNALVGIVAGGIIGGIEAGAGKVGLAGARGTFMQPVSRELVKETVVGEATGGAAFAKGAAAGAAKSAVKAVRNAALSEAPTAAKELVDATNRPGETPAGRSSPHGASVPVKEPNQSSGPRIPELLPEAVAPVRIQG